VTRGTMSRMFSFITRTWNPLGGRCPHSCVYCWSMGKRGLVNRYNMQKYQGGPWLIEKELNRRFKPGEFVFVQDMSDLWAREVSSELIAKVLDVVEASPHATFLFLTKNPERYLEFVGQLPPNAVLGATVETDRSYFEHERYGERLYEEISQAPLPALRLHAMEKLKELRQNRLFISIEPVLDFDLGIFIDHLWRIHPWAVCVGYDNYGYRLPEPPLNKTMQLIEKLKAFTRVICKTIRLAWWEV